MIYISFYLAELHFLASPIMYYVIPISDSASPQKMLSNDIYISPYLTELPFLAPSIPYQAILISESKSPLVIRVSSSISSRTFWGSRFEPQVWVRPLLEPEPAKRFGFRYSAEPDCRTPGSKSGSDRVRKVRELDHGQSHYECRAIL